jgi:hypothetical protein
MRLKITVLGAALATMATMLPVHSAPARKHAAATKNSAAKTAASRSWVRLKAMTDRPRYTVGQPITVRLIASNTSKHGAYLRFSSGQRFDFSVIREGSRETAYTWSATRMFILSRGSLWLKPGQSQSYSATIGDEMGPLAAGRYRLEAHLTNSPRGITAPPVRFEVVDTGVSVTAKTDKLVYKVGEPVRVDVALVNQSGAERILPFVSGLTFDGIISDETGKQVWTYGANLRFIRVLGSVSWRKGETKNYTAEWNGGPLPGENGSAVLKPGRYQVQAVLQSTPRVYAPPLFIEIQ